MGSWAEKMIVEQMQEKSKIKEEEIALHNRIVRERKHEANILGLRRFTHKLTMDSDWLWRVISYTYFVCRTLGFLLLVDLVIFGRPNITLFVLIFLCCYQFNKILFKKIFTRVGRSGKINKGTILPNGNCHMAVGSSTQLFESSLSSK